ncbi:MAG: (deoxy)nucleoside triphosphate pyrophosphohydrolase [Pseudomonadota bacterium]
MKIMYVAAGALFNGSGEVLLAQRPEGKAMAGLWEFPGGKIEANESPEAALCRELYEELQIEVKEASLEPLTFASHRYDHFHLLMPLFRVRQWIGSPEPVEGQQLAWVAPDAMDQYPAPEADLPLFRYLRHLPVETLGRS